MVKGVRSAFDLDGDLLFDIIQVFFGDDAFEGTADVFEEFLIRLTIEHLDQGLVRVENLFFVVVGAIN